MNRIFTLAISCLVLLMVSCSKDTPQSSSTDARSDSPDVVSIEDARTISSTPEFQSNPEWVHTKPEASPDAPEPCRNAYDQLALFGGSWSQFRSVTYNATIDDPIVPDIAKITQTVAVYDDDRSAQSIFEKIENSLARCATANIEFYSKPVEHVDQSTLILKGDASTYIYKVRQSRIVYVAAGGSFDTSHTATEIANRL